MLRRRSPFPTPPPPPPSPPALLHKILTESPTARITIPDIKKDRWYSKPLKKGKGPPGNVLVPPRFEGWGGGGYWVSCPFAGVKRARVSSGGVADSPGGFSKHVRSDTDFSPVKNVLG